MTEINRGETIEYLKVVNTFLSELSRLNAKKKNTLKKRAISTLITVFSQRVKAKLDILNAHINDDSAYIAGRQIQESIYNDVIQWLQQEIDT